MAAASVVTTTGAGGYVQAIADGDYTVGRYDKLVKVSTTGAACVLTLPDATKLGGEMFAIVRTAGILNAITVQGGGGQLVNGAASITLALPLYSCGLFISDGVNWFRVGAI